MKVFAVLINAFFFPTLVLTAMSGNDKSPFIVIILAGLSLIGAFVSLLIGRRKMALLISIPFIYFGLALILSWLGLIDPLLLLGFR